MSNHLYNKIVNTGLIFCYDAGNTKSYLSGSNTWYDLSKNGYNGSLSSGIGYDTGSRGNLTFNGTNQIIIPDNPNLNLATFTYEGWLLNNSGNLFWDRVISKKNSFSDTEGYEIACHTGTSQTMYISGQGNIFAVINNVVNWVDGKWHHLVVVFNNTTVTVYADGTYKGQGNILAIQPNTRNLEIGRLEGEAGLTQWRGKMSIVRMYNRILSADEILQNYNAMKYSFLV